MIDESDLEGLSEEQKQLILSMLLEEMEVHDL